MNAFFPRRLLVLTLLAVAGVLAAAEPAPRERLLMDFGWRFHLGNEWGIAQNLAKSGTGYGAASPIFSDASWRKVDLPHDWAIELPFDPKADAAHGFRAVGPAFPENSVGWYRRTFELPAADSGRRLWLEFDGVFRDCTVFVNGWFVGHHESGYSSFRYDITDVANCGGRNVVAVKVDASQYEGWFYEGAGIYRHVWLEKTGPVAVVPDGVFVYSHFKDNIPAGAAEIHLETELANSAAAAAGTHVDWTIFGPDGQQVATARADVALDAHAQGKVTQTTRVEQPALWSPESPRRYKLVTKVTAGGKVVDQVETAFGIRTYAFDANRGFLLNGKPYPLKGTCNHQDHAGVGAALPDRLQYFRIAKLKEMGANAYRTAHNPPTSELLDACDELGMLVMDENRLLGSDPLHHELLEELIRRDRNRACVAIWSLGNEEFSTAMTPSGGRVAATMQRTILALDPTRPITYNADVGNVFEGVNQVIEVRGWSYRIGVDRMDAYHAAHPNQPNVGSEQGSTVSTRGIYHADPEKGYVTAYDDNKQEWSNTAEEWVTFFDSRPWLSGGFVWTGFDYRGEPTPYGWPCVNSHFGLYDTCGFPKDNFWYYKAWWTSEPVLHLLPHWNWAGHEGEEIDVRAESNCDEVELFLNGQSLGRQAMKRDSELKWRVKYAPGVLAAKGFRGGKLVAETANETTGAPAAVRLAADRPSIRADARDVSVITVSIADAKGRTVPVAMNHVDFSLEGPGRILGVGNGDPSSHEADTLVATPVIHAVPVTGWRWKKIEGDHVTDLPEEAAVFDDSGWNMFSPDTEQGPLGSHERGVFRAHFNLTDADLAAPAAELWFGRIEGDGTVYVNGKRVGATGDPHAASAYAVKELLHPGENTIAIGIMNWGEATGPRQGTAVRFIRDGEPGQWSRSVFNGYAQVIVQSTREAGPIRLTARAAGLEPATVELQATTSAQPPALP